MKRHPMTAIAFALMTAIAAGCSSERDDRADYSDSGPADRAPMAGGNDLMTQLMQWERRDMGVAPIRELHDGQMHGPTPNQIPGGQVITTVGLKALLEQRVGAQVIDVLGSEAALPDAIPGVFASAPGSFDDRTQEKLGRMLSSVTRNDPRVPLVFYCGGPECWMSYNAALRAIALGYRNVLWYRGGLEAWNHAGLPFARRGNSGNSGYGAIGASGPAGTNPLNRGYDRG